MDYHIYKQKKVIAIGIVKELTGLSERQIRYYEERKLIFPERSEKGTRKYSFSDVEKLVDIAEKVKKGTSTYSMRQKLVKDGHQDDRKKIIQGQINARFGIQKQLY